ncbi:hypothetical protein D0509_06340 [Weissella cibaria]|nr:hypothetical protein [Weissella cibaria]MCT8401307.1 hypothetical protein [Weissella cibaria]
MVLKQQKEKTFDFSNVLLVTRRSLPISLVGNLYLIYIRNKSIFDELIIPDSRTFRHESGIFHKMQF